MTVIERDGGCWINKSRGLRTGAIGISPPAFAASDFGSSAKQRCSACSVSDSQDVYSVYARLNLQEMCNVYMFSSLLEIKYSQRASNNEIMMEAHRSGNIRELYVRQPTCCHCRFEGDRYIRYSPFMGTRLQKKR